MIASEDVRRVTFDKTMRGYRCEDVDDYLKQVADSMDALSAENEDLQKKLVVLAQRIDQYRAEEDTLHTTLINAQRLGENVIKEAKQKAAEVIRAANIKAEDREQRARDEVELAHQELATIHKETTNFKKSLLDMYRKHIELLSQIPADPMPEAATADQAQDSAAPAQTPVYETPAPEPEPDPEPAQPAYPEEKVEEYPPQPDYTEPQPQTQTQQEDESYYEDPEDSLPEPGEEKVDTVEFAIAPKPDEPEDLRETPPDPDPQPVRQNNFKPGAGLYDVPGEEEESPAPKKATRRSTRSKSTGTSRSRGKKQQPSDTGLPASFDTFAGVDFDS